MIDLTCHDGEDVSTRLHILMDVEGIKEREIPRHILTN